VKKELSQNSAQYFQSHNDELETELSKVRAEDGNLDLRTSMLGQEFCQTSMITLVNTQNVSITKRVDLPSIQCAESKYGLRSQFVALVVIIHEVWLKA
jgi:hypothetical protein